MPVQISRDRIQDVLMPVELREQGEESEDHTEHHQHVKDIRNHSENTDCCLFRKIGINLFFEEKEFA